MNICIMFLLISLTNAFGEYSEKEKDVAKIEACITKHYETSTLPTHDNEASKRCFEERARITKKYDLSFMDCRGTSTPTKKGSFKCALVEKQKFLAQTPELLKAAKDLGVCWDKAREHVKDIKQDLDGNTFGPGVKPYAAQKKICEELRESIKKDFSAKSAACELINETMRCSIR